MSLGEDRVRVKFNPSNDDLVSRIKQKSAELIDLCELHRQEASGVRGEAASEAVRLWSLAMTHYEDAAMWAVKAATAPTAKA